LTAKPGSPVQSWPRAAGSVKKVFAERDLLPVDNTAT
jgi:hypothetical protein